MKYVGSKNRYAKAILPIILKGRGDLQYVEPFCGGCNLIDKVGGLRLANDINGPLISLLQMLAGGWSPPPVTKEMYKTIQHNKDSYPDYLVAYVGYQLSFGAKYFGGYRSDKSGKRDYSIEAQTNVLKQAPNLVGIQFSNMNYYDMVLESKSIIYCDPPYRNVMGYGIEFDHDQFYDWCRSMKKDGHIVYVSEYDMPDDFTCVWEVEVNHSIDSSNKIKKATERLFKL